MSLLPVGAIPVVGGYNINNSLRFRAGAGAWLNRTPSSASNRTTWTRSLWVKRGSVETGINQRIAFAGANQDNADIISFSTTDAIRMTRLDAAALTDELITTQVFRDPSAWYHIVVAYDSTQATASNRIKLYVNGSQITSFSTANYPVLNQNTYINSVTPHYIGRPHNAAEYFDGYMAEIYFIDGQALTPSDFGETDTDTGVWKPKAYSGTYGTNGFYLNFSDIATTSGSNAGLGKDFSGNTNYWTTNNISVTSGVTYDAMTDSPTLTSDTVSNYCVLNDISTLTTATLSNANLAFTTATTGHNAIGSVGMSSGKYYWEAQTSAGTTQARATVYGTAASTYYSFAANNTVYGFRFDADAGTLDYTTDGTNWVSLATGLTSGPYFPYFNNNGTTSKTISVNFGQRPFTYTPPTGYNRLNTFNLPTSTILKGDKYMDATLYTGTGVSRSVTNAAGFRPDFVWIKGRSGATDHALYDAVRGTTNDLVSNSTAAATTQAQGLTAFNSNGFTVGTLAKLNTNAATYVAWQWQADSSTVTNTSGTISAQVRANTTAGFSIVTYTGTGANATVGHGLGVAPNMIIVKQRNTNRNWTVYHSANTGAPETDYLVLNTQDATVDLNTVWNDTAPTSSVFSIGTTSVVNISGGLYLAYCWTQIAGFSAFGSYSGNGSNDGTFVYTGFRPKYVMIKRSNATDSWRLFDSFRTSSFNGGVGILYAEVADAEGQNVNQIDILSNGFKARSSAWTSVSGGNYIYMAFAENPFKNSLAR